MKIYLPFDFQADLRIFLRRAGYWEKNDFNQNQVSYIRRLGRDYYPRFHVYPDQDKDNRHFLNLHLDQKKPSYPGARAHNAEHEGAVVEQEAARLLGLIKNQLDNQKQSVASTNSNEEKSFWRRWLGR